MRLPRGLLAGLLCGIASATLAQVSPNGGEFQVNSYTSYYQGYPAVASDAQGRFVVVWQSQGSDGTDTDTPSIQSQRYGVGGTPLGPQFQVNTFTFGVQSTPVVASDATGRFVVAWSSFGSGVTDHDSWSVGAQRFGADGIPSGSQFQVNTYTTSGQSLPAIAANSTGNFVVAWVSDGSSGSDTDSNSIQAQRYDATGAAQGGEFQVNTYTTGVQEDPAVAMDDLGGFVVAWVSYGSGGSDTSALSIQAQRFAANGAPAGPQFQVNTYTSSDQFDPAVVTDAQGNFVVAWSSLGSSGTDTSYGSIQAQRFGANGTPLGGEFQVNTYTTNNQGNPAAAVDSRGNFVITWWSYGSSGPDTSAGSVQARRYLTNGAPLGPQFQVNTYTNDGQDYPTVDTDGRGNFVIAWQSFGSSGTDTSGLSIQAQRYDELFRDGLESGNSSRWSQTLP